MLIIDIPAREMFDERTSEFITIPKTTLHLEHSLISLSKWEAKWNTPFFNNSGKTVEQNLDYIRCMTIDKNVDPMAYHGLTAKNLETIDKYTSEPHTATVINHGPSSSKNSYVKPGSSEGWTSELIYYYMIAFNIPFSCEKWHLNRLMTLIDICSIKNTPSKKMSKDELIRNNAALNAKRKAALHTKG